MSVPQPRQSRVDRLWRLVRVGRSPLARGCDRVEAGAAILAVVVALLALPIVASAGSETYARSVQEARQEASAVHRSTATLLADAPARPHGDEGWTAPAARVRAHWVTPDGADRTGIVSAEYETPRGTEVTIWLDDRGEPTAEPMTSGDAAARGVGTALGLWLVTLAGLAGALWLLHQALERLRYARWSREWDRFGHQRSPRDHG